MLQKFLQTSPLSISTVLATQKVLNSTRLVQLADELMHLIKATSKTSMRYQIQTKGLRPRTSPTTQRGQPQKISKTFIYYADAARSCKHRCKWLDKNIYRRNKTANFVSIFLSSKSSGKLMGQTPHASRVCHFYRYQQF